MSDIQKNNPTPLRTLALLAAQLPRALIVVLFFGATTLQANARDYKIEVILFENTNPSIATDSHDYEPPKRMKSGSETWRLSPTMLIEQADILGKSSNYQVKYHYSWGVESLPYQKSASYSITERDAQGYIKVYADQLLFANIDLDYNGFRLKEKRRLKLNEKHFFDHPKFGLLMQVSRLEPEEKEPESPEVELNSSR